MGPYWPSSGCVSVLVICRMSITTLHSEPLLWLTFCTCSKALYLLWQVWYDGSYPLLVSPYRSGLDSFFFIRCGSLVQLCFLYQQLGSTSRAYTAQMCGFLTLLKCRIFEHFPENHIEEDRLSWWTLSFTTGDIEAPWHHCWPTA